MGHLLSALFRFLRRNLFLFVAIVLVLLLGNWVRDEWRQMRRTAAEVPALQAALQQVEQGQRVLAGEVTGRVRRLAGAPVGQLDAAIAELDQEIAGLQREQGNEDRGALLLAALDSPEAIALRLREAASRAAAIELRRQARTHLLAVRAHAIVLGDRQAAERRLAQLRLAHVQAYARVTQAQAQLERTRAQAGVLARIPFGPAHARIRRMETEVRALVAANNRAHQAFVAQQVLLRRLSAPAVPASFRVDEGRLALAGEALRARLAQAQTLAAQNHVWQAWLAVRPVLPVALGVLLGWWLVPAAIRTVFYFVLAPLAARRPPLVIDAASRPRASLPGGARMSAVSQRVQLAAGDELLIRPEYCQSQPAGVTTTTRVLFDWRHPLTSIAAHLWLLKRMRAAHGERGAQNAGIAEIVVSATADPLDEVALLRVAAGEAVVLQPRALVGMAYQAGRQPAIRSHWRIGTLHAWLTLQLRYLAFEGPATLVVKGCRGVRLESAGRGRTVSQQATLGFSADALYATVRAEPFLPYLRGTQPLFHDRFEGAAAWYLYEEVPRNARSGRPGHNPLDWLLDAGLKAFGI